MRITSWVLLEPRSPFVLREREEKADPGEVIVQVAGCGVCHTDLGFVYDGVPMRGALPLTLGHEISGTVVEAGAGAEAWRGRSVVVPAVMPCGLCDACLAQRGSICKRQIFPGNDIDGGFGSHLKVPARGLCPVQGLEDAPSGASSIDLASLAVVADAISTPYQAILRSRLTQGDLAVFVGVGGVGGFGVQIAKAFSAHVVAIDVDPQRLSALARHGADLTLQADQFSPRELKSAVRTFAEEREVPSWQQRIFETSGTPAGQSTAFGLLGPGGYLSVVGYTKQAVELKLSNLMAFDASVQGNWGCLPEHYPAVLDLVLSGKVQIAPFIERRPLSQIQRSFEEIHEHKIFRRIVLIPGE